MGFKVNVNINKLAQRGESYGKRILGDLQDVVKKSVDDKTPVDTSKLLVNNKKSPIEKVGNKLIAKVSNETEYAKYVEYGVLGKEYNYNIPNDPNYKGVGARMYRRTLKEITSEKKWKNKK